MDIAYTTHYGDREVPLVKRFWKIAERRPYRKTYRLKPGQSWREADETPHQSESYVLLDDGDVIPVGAMIARELMSQGALSAVFTELWGGVVLVNPDLICLSEEGSIKEVLDAIRAANNGKLGGLPDVLAIFPEGKICMREAKIFKKDRLQKNQHDFARIAQTIFGNRLDLAVVEWGYASTSIDAV